MKTISLRSSPTSNGPTGTHAKAGVVDLIRSGSRKLAQAVRKQEDIFAAVGLAEGGDVEGAAELLERVRSAKH